MSADYKVAKLADFGLARPLVRRPSRHDSSSGDDAQGEGGMTPRIGPRKYRAPEVEAGKAYGTQVDLVGVLADVARALVRLHSAGHIHRDVKARNVLVRP